MSIWSKYSTTLSSSSSKATEGLKRRGAQLTRCLASSRGSACRSITDRNTVFPNTGHASRAAQPAPSRNSTPHSKRVTQPPEPSQLLVNFWPERSLEQQLMSARLTATIRYNLQSRATRRCSTPISPSSPLSLLGLMRQFLEMAGRKVCLPSSRDFRSRNPSLWARGAAMIGRRGISPGLVDQNNCLLKDYCCIHLSPKTFNRSDKPATRAI